MDPNQEILLELKKVNEKINIYTNPVKSAWFNFVAGTFHALGSIFGTLIIASVVVYLFSRFNFTSSILKWFEDTLTHVNWTKIISPQIQTFQEKTIQVSE